ncbi:hypothetical protein JCM9534A_35240 [Catenuloplanes indicus JCM 9534]|uniref:Uncharacterized protein n=1 Tax=Catenuloplanes indicus TaxID=137267 RepID=A0AAE3W031_9ACTN|nr:hypothetical protein [Catenuloplanes indicus]
MHAQHARIVDWGGWATRGAPWLDCGYWLIAAGHHPRAAEQLAGGVAVWRTATRDGADAFATGKAAMWAGIGGDDPDPWTRKLVQASAAWHTYRVSAAS